MALLDISTFTMEQLKEWLETYEYSVQELKEEISRREQEGYNMCICCSNCHTLFEASKKYTECPNCGETVKSNQEGK